MASNLAKSKVIKVALDDSGDFKTVQEAIDSVPLKNSQRVVIKVASGIYKQPVYVAKTKNKITLLGERPETTVLTWSNTATSIKHPLAASNVIGTGTFASGTVIVEAEDFIAEGITFENAAPQGSGHAVAIRVTGDRSAFYNCRFLGWQDTVYLHYGRIYLRDCYVEGSVDFIFGNATVLLEHCHIHCKAAGFITAHNRSSASETTGCTITGTGSSSGPYMYLGRPWGPYARVLFAYTWMDTCIKPEGWYISDNTKNETTSSYYEYGCFGPGSDTSKRVSWARKIDDQEIKKFISMNFIDGESTWLASSTSSKAPSIPVPLSA